MIDPMNDSECATVTTKSPSRLATPGTMANLTSTWIEIQTKATFPMSRGSAIISGPARSRELPGNRVSIQRCASSGAEVHDPEERGGAVVHAIVREVENPADPGASPVHRHAGDRTMRDAIHLARDHLELPRHRAIGPLLGVERERAPFTGDDHVRAAAGRLHHRTCQIRA